MLQFAIPCLLGLESLVGDEVKKLGLADIRVENGRVLCRGEERDLARLNINLRCGARVLLVLADFRATDFETLFQGTRAVRWEDWIPREGEFPVTGYSINSTLHSVPACQSIVKKAVVERLGAAYGLQTLPETGKRYQIRFSIMKDEAMDNEFHDKTYEIWGGDIDPHAIEIARHNAELAEVDDTVRFEVDNATRFHWGGQYGRVVTNPPYGERLLEQKEAEELYRAFGRAVDKLPETWRVYVLSSHTEFERCFGRIADKKRKLYNGMLKCDLFMYGKRL